MIATVLSDTILFAFKTYQAKMQTTLSQMAVKVVE